MIETAQERTPERGGVQSLSAAQSVQMFKTALLIRRVEEEVARMIGVDFPGTTHFCIGQEMTAVAVLSCLGEKDWVFSNHRNRAHLIARGADPGRVLAELSGKAEGYSKGKAGSFHICVPELGMPATSAIVGGNLPLAVGAALGSRLDGEGRVSLVFFGDGAINEGAFHEALNLATLWKVPVIFLCENNDAVPYSPAGSGLSMQDIPAWVRGYGLPAIGVNGNDVEAIVREVFVAVRRARGGEGPSFIEVRTHRGPLNQLAAPSLPQGAFNVEEAWSPAAQHPMPAWRDVDPLLSFERRLLEKGIVDRQELQKLDEEATRRAGQAAEFARSAAYAPLEAALEDVYA